MVGGWFKTRSRASGAVHVDRFAASAAYDVMVVVSNPRLVSGGMTRRLNSPDEADILEDVQIVIHGLGGECAEPLASGDCNGVRVPMLPLAHDRHKYSDARGGNTQTGPVQGFVDCVLIGGHVKHYEL
jgi:hypothetical protein